MATPDNDLRRRVQALLRAELHLDVDDHEIDLFAGGFLDSLLFVELLLALETAFGIQVPAEELEIDDFRSISRIAAFIQRRAAPNEAPSFRRRRHTPETYPS